MKIEKKLKVRRSERSALEGVPKVQTPAQAYAK
jgi:hypothetical protein